MKTFDWTPEWFGPVPGRGVGQALGIAGGLVMLFALLILLFGSTQAFSGRPFSPPLLLTVIYAASVAVVGLILIGLGVTCRNVARIREILEERRPETPPSRPLPLARNE